MNQKDFSHVVASIFRKTVIVLSGLILSLVLLEAGLRLGGFILSSIQEFENLQSIKQKGVYRILCLGESTTEGQYPQLLEHTLNQRNIGLRFKVIDKGKSAINTFFILGQIESYLAAYHPDMVVAMMGINDPGIKYYQDISESRTWIFRHCRVYRFGRILYAYLLKKLGKKDIYGSVRTDRERKPRLDDKGAAIEKAGLSSEVSVDGVAKLDPKNGKGSFGARSFSQRGDSLFEPPRSPPKTALRLGRLYRAQGELSKAEDVFKKVIELNPKNDHAYVELGWLEQQQRGCGCRQAEDFFKKAIGINPKNDHAYTGLGLACQRRGKLSQLSQAEDFYRKAIELNPRNYYACAGLGELYRDQGKFPKAEDFLKKAIEINPENNLAFLDLVELYRRQNKFSQAEDILRKAIELNPDNDRILGAMALLCKETGKMELAKEYAEKVNALRSEYYAPVTVNNYRKLKEILDGKGIKLVCAQYPVRNVEPLKKIFEKDKGVIFVDNERVFKKVLKKGSYKEYFIDMFGGDFGHCTQKGNELLAQNIADVILREVFNKR